MNLIPAYIDDSSPPGEKVLFSSFECFEKEWTVIHSLDLAPYNKNRRTEIDFVVIIPEAGILCIEVKSQNSIFFDGNRWQPDSIKRSPFKQALDARYAFRRRLVDYFGVRFAHVPVIHSCIFPMSNFSIENNLSIRNYEVIDRKLFDKKSPSELARNIQRNFMLAVEQDPQMSKLNSPLSREDIQMIVEFCYPVRKRKPELTEEVKRKQTELEGKLLIQQKPILLLTELNSRVLVEGGAGTGKSLIGMEVARRKAMQGKRVAYLCFNKLIGKASESLLSNAELPNLVAGSVFSVLQKMTEVVTPPGADFEWWERTCLEQIEERLTAPDFAGSCYFDYLVLDEAQDVLARPALWNCLTLFLGKSLKESNFLILGDFTNQTLISDLEPMKFNLSEIKRVSASWLLDENCRNYKQIGTVALTLSATDEMTWSGYLRTGGSMENWAIKPFVNDTEQVSHILDCIKEAKSKGFIDKDITILTFNSTAKSVIRHLVNDNLTVAKADDFDSTHIRYSTINAFKGMENKVIIISDINISSHNTERERKVFYTGMTRATEMLYMLCRESTKEILMKWVLNGKI